MAKPDYSTSVNRTRIGKIFFLLSLIVFLFWLLAGVINVYHFSVVGAIFEILWLPVIAITFGLPVFSFIYWVKKKFNLRSFYFYSIIMMLATGLLIVFMNS